MNTKKTQQKIIEEFKENYFHFSDMGMLVDFNGKNTVDIDDFFTKSLEEMRDLAYKDGYQDGLGDKKLVAVANDGLSELLKKTEELVSQLTNSSKEEDARKGV